MSPSTAVARPAWVWSLPAVAVFISFLWFRKKRLALQTDTGGAGESGGETIQSDQVSSASDVESVIKNNTAAQKAEVDNQVKETPVEAEAHVKPVTQVAFFTEEDEVLQIEVKETPEKVEAVTEKVLQVREIPEAVEEVLGTPGSVIEEDEILQIEVKETPEAAEEDVVLQIDVKKAPEAVEEVAAAVRVLPVTQVAPSLEEAVEDLIESEESGEVATQKESSVKAEDAVPASSPALKGSKKRRQRKSVKLGDSPAMSNEGGAGEGALEQQLASLELDAVKDGVQAAGETTQERDSANNSPSEVMLASPSLSGYSDTHSEGSSDSGKGCSEVLTPSPTPVSGNSVSGDLPATCVYEFVIPQHLVGRLIGRNGSYIHEIKDNTHASIYIKRHPDTPKLKICAIEGTQMDIESALDMVRLKFPKKRYPNVTLEAVELAQEVAVPVLPDNLQLYLVEGVNNDVILSSLVSAGHFFLQQPTHPTYLSLNRLNSCMAICYAEPNLPALPDDIAPGVLCAAPVHSGWYRAEVTSFPEDGIVDVKFVDYGGYLTIAKTELRQIRADFVTLPFQAAECFLAGVQPVGEEGVWSEEAKAVVEKLTLGKLLQAQVHGYTDTSIPLIYLFTVYNNEVACINEELVAQGYAEWLLPEPVTEEIPCVE